MITINPIIPAEFLPVGKTIKETAWEVSTQPLFNIENYIVGRMPFNIVNTTTATFAIDETGLLSKNLYIRVQYKFTDDTVSKFTKHFKFEIPDFIGFVSSSLIKIPEIKSHLSYSVVEGDMKGHLVLEADPFRDFNEKTEHAETTWVISEFGGNEIVNHVAHWLNSPANLTSISIPLELISDEKSYNIELTYKAKNDDLSGTASYKYETFIVGDYFKGNMVSEVVSGRVVYFTIEPYTTKYDQINIQMFNTNGDVVAEWLAQETLTPRLAIPSGLSTSEQYTIKGYVTLEDGSNSPLEMIAEVVIKENNLYLIDGLAYPEVFSYAGDLANGINNIQSSIQLEDGIILLGNNIQKKINKYKFVNNRLVFVGTALTIEDSENIGPLHLNIVKLHNGQILVNYGTNTKHVKNQGNVFKLFNYNPVTQELILANQLRFTNMGYSTALTTSLVSTKQNAIYFIPSYHVDQDGDKQNLYIYKINLTTFTIEKTVPLPFAAKQNVSLIPTKETDKFLILNGSENQYEVNGKMVWKRENHKVYKFTAGSDIINETSLNLYNGNEYLIDPYIACVQGYVRRDGKVMLFNSTESGPQIYNQNVHIIDTDTETVMEVLNDMPDEYIYRSTVRLNDGGFLRLSTTFDTVNRVYHYPAGRDSKITAPLDEDLIGTLVIAPDEVKYITTVNFEKIIIEGDSLANTGKLILLSGETETEYTYGTLIIGADTTISTADQLFYSQIVVLNNAVVTVVS